MTESMPSYPFPRIIQIVIDCVSPRKMAEFYHQLFGLEYAEGHEPPAPGQPDPTGEDWLNLRNPYGGIDLAFQAVDRLPRTTWPEDDIPQQLHLDTAVADFDSLVYHKDRALKLGATVLDDRSDDPLEALWVLADPEGHPFCIFVSGE